MLGYRASDNRCRLTTHRMRKRSEIERAPGGLHARIFGARGNDSSRATGTLLAVSMALAALLLEPAANAAPDFSGEVRPLLEKHCFKCHGPEKQKGGLRFDTKEGTFKTGESGEKAIVPGHPNQSRLIKLVSSNHEEERMPSKGKPLSAAQIDLLKRWIEGGAEWPASATPTSVVARAEMIVTDQDRKHWSYLPLRSPALPPVTESGVGRTAIDRFVLARLQGQKLAPSPRA